MSATRAVRVDIADILAATATIDDAERTEMAVPAYAHRNPLIRWLFWSRLDAAVRLAELRPGAAVLDFGSGAGVLLPSLKAYATRIVATDLELAPSRTVASARGIAAEFVELPEFRSWSERNIGALDRIFALDVLEHVDADELRELSRVFRSLLTPEGRLVISGPTESRAYRLGRALAGFKNLYHHQSINVYHHRNIFDIDDVLATHWRVVARVFIPRPPLPRAFEIISYAAT